MLPLRRDHGDWVADAGIVGMLISLFTMTLWNRDRRGAGVVEERRVVDRRDPYRDPYA